MSTKWDERVHIGVACFIGSLFGGLIGREVVSTFALGTYFIWVGALAGGLIGCLTYRFKQVLIAVKKAGENFLLSLLSILNWRPNWVKFWGGVIFGGLFAQALAVEAFGLVLGLALAEDGNPVQGFLVFASCIFVVFLGLFGCIHLYWLDNEAQERRQVILTRFWIHNPFAVFIYGFMVQLFTFSVRVIEVFAALFMVVVSLAWLTPKFVWEVFVLIHSRERTICTIDSAIGALIATVLGYGLPGLLAGAVMGCLLGVLNYELVSVRWLKLLPAKS